jgi:Helix-turn-helix domain
MTNEGSVFTRRLGVSFRPSLTTAYEAAHRGELPVRLIGRRMLVPRAALLRLLEHEQDAPLDSRPT